MKVSPLIQTGDLLFLGLGCGDLCDAIVNVTKRQFGVPGPSLSHVGILSQENGRWFVYEAWDGVQRTPYERVASRVEKLPLAEKRLRFGHIKGLTAEERLRVVAIARKYLGTPYDEDFRRNNEKYYCSELVADVFLEALPNRKLFSYRPMYFGDPQDASDRAWKTWRAYFEKKHRDVPAGELGVNPLGIYLAEDVEPVDGDSKKLSIVSPE